MSPRGSQGPGEKKRSTRQTSVVGSKVRDVSNRLQGRGLPKGGIRERDGLKVAEGAMPDTTIVGAARANGIISHVLRIVAIVSGSLAAILVIVALAIAVLSHTTVFTITSIETVDSDHLTADDIARLANVEEGATLLNIDADAIERGVKKNPWVAAVEVSRAFPATLRIGVHERQLGALVAMSSGGLAWFLGADGVWIEPTRVESGADESVNDAALAMAESMGVILISDVPASVAPVAGTHATDASIGAVMSFRDQLSSAFQEDVVSYSASSEDDISCILKSGVEVSLGSATDVRSKETVARRILEEYPGQITYINVRTPSRPSYRWVDSPYVGAGTGATGSAVDDSGFDKPQETQDAATEAEASESETGAEGAGYAEDGSGAYVDDYSDPDYSSDYDDTSAYDGYGYDDSSAYDDYSDYDDTYDTYGYDEYGYGGY